MKKVIGFVLVMALAISAFSIQGFAAFQSTVLNNPDYSLQENGILYQEKALEEAGKQAIFYGEYNSTAPNAKYEWVIHSIRDGSDTTLTTVMDIAKDFEAKTGRKVMLAANGDYFDFGSGANMESYVNDGIVVSKGSFATKHCIGFDNQGKVTVGRMTDVEKRLVVTVDGEKHFFHIDRFNEEPGNNEIAIYTNSGKHTVTDAGYYVCASDSANLNQYPVYGTSRRMSQGTVQGGGSFTLKSGQFAVVVKGENAQFFYDKVMYNVPVDLVEIPAGSYSGCSWVLGGYDILVENGTVGTKFHTDNGGSSAAPRTFIGFKKDGTGFICCVDGRQSGYSIGITVTKEAELAKALGAEFALELDGGGSTTMIVRIDDQLTLRNKPSDGSMRRVSNAILLVEKEDAPVVNPGPDPTVPSTQPTTVPVVPTEPTDAPTTAPTAQPTAEPTVSTTVPTQGTRPTEPAPTQPSGQEPASPTMYILIGAVAVIVIAVAAIVIIRKKKHGGN